MHIKKNLLAAAMATAIFAPLPAAADVIAQSVLQVSNFVFLGSTDGGTTFTQLGVGDFDRLLFTDSTDVSATLGGTTDSDSDTTTDFSGLDVGQVCVGACSFGENDYSEHSFPPTETTARADSELAGAPLSETGFDLGAEANTMSEVQIDAGSTTGTAESNLGLIATFSFSTLLDQIIQIDFDVNQWIVAALGLDTLVPGSSAQASTAWSLEILQGSTEVFGWTPDGQGGGITGGSVNDDDCDLSRTIAVQLPGDSANVDCAGNMNAQTSFALLADNNYTLNLRHETTADANQVVDVPAPGTLALIGLGVFGLGWARRKV